MVKGISEIYNELQYKNNTKSVKESTEVSMNDIALS